MALMGSKIMTNCAICQKCFRGAFYKPSDHDLARALIPSNADLLWMFQRTEIPEIYLSIANQSLNPVHPHLK